jgi:hypothetical protein
MQQVRQSTVLIPTGAALSTVSVDLRNEQLVAVIMPDGWDAASLTFQAGIDGATFGNVFLVTGELSFPTADVAAGNLLAFDTRLTAGLRYLKVRSGTSASAVNQTADRMLTLLTRDLAD